MTQALDLIGQRFGRLLVIEKMVQRDRFKKVVWKCKCDCGNEHLINTKSLRSSNVQSCGWLRVELTTTHGKRNTREYSIWNQMKTRCFNSNHVYFNKYGGRGITVCNEWMLFENFFNDMGLAPPKHTLERIDNNKGYSKENCKWATRKEQAVNRSSTKFLTFDGQTKSISDWAREIGIRIDTLHYRISRGWNIEKALTTPTIRKRNV